MDAPSDDRVSFIGGPYLTPSVRPGDWLNDEIEGLVQVGGYSSGLIPWPRRRKTGRASLVLCAALADAVRNESALAVAHHFGVGLVTVAKWRAALGVDRQNNAGTQAQYHALMPGKLTKERAARGRTSAKQPDAIARMAASKTGRAAHPNTRAGLLRGARAPKPEGWGKRANAWMRPRPDETP